MSSIELILGFLTVFLAGWAFVKRRYSYWRNFNIPYEEPAFPYGNIQGMGKKYAQFEVHEKIYKKFKKNLFATPFVGLFYYLKPVILCMDMEFIKNVFTKDSSHFIDRGAYYNEKDCPISAHLFNLDNPKWKVLRTKLTPTFTSGKIKMMFHTVCDVAERFVAKLDSEVDLAVDGAIEMKEFGARFTTDVIGSVAFGLDINSLDQPDTEFRVQGVKAFEKPNHSALVIMFCLAFKDLGRKLHISLLRRDMEQFFQKIVRDTVEHREKTGLVRNDLMHLMIQLKNRGRLDDESTEIGKLTMDEITAQCFIFFIAGYETSSTAMGYTLYELAYNQEIQDKLRKHIQKVLEKHDNKLTYEAVKDMDYLLMCLNESLRKYPPVHTLLRYCNEDYKVEGTNYTIKKGQLLAIPAHSIHHDPEIYPDPEVYNPDRFLPSEAAKRPACSFLAFGHGPRNCIGLRFGVIQAQIGLAMLLTKFKFEVSPKTVTPIVYKKFMPIMLSPVDGITLKVTRI